MSLGDRMAILHDQGGEGAGTRRQPPDRGRSRTPYPSSKGRGTISLTSDRGVADWAGVQAQAAAAPFVAALQDQMAPREWSSFEGALATLSTGGQENGPIFIAAWGEHCGGNSVGDREVIVPIFEWAWPYIEQIYSGVLDTMLGVARIISSGFVSRATCSIVTYLTECIYSLTQQVV